MKSHVIAGFAATVLGVAMAATSAHAITYTVDSLIGAIDSANSGQAYETAQLELACACDVTLLSNVNISNAGVQTDDAGSNFINVAPSTPGYFLLKFGTGNQGNDMFFFENVPDLTKLVWTDAHSLPGLVFQEIMSTASVITR